MIINGAKRVPEDSKQIIMRYSHKKQYHIKIAENLLVIGILYHDLRDYKSFLYSLFLSKSVDGSNRPGVRIPPSPPEPAVVIPLQVFIYASCSSFSGRLNIPFMAFAEASCAE